MKRNRVRDSVLWFLILGCGVLLRIYKFGIAPGNGAMHKDEAYAAYEAWSLLHYGIDSHGYHYPVYFSAWNSGMNVLESYLMIPFIRIWGLNNVTARLPQLITAICSLPAFYFLVKKIIGKKAAYIAMGILSLAPWHIMMSRWGLESNLFPSFFLFGLVFLLYGDNKQYRFLFTGFFWGLSLYCYSAMWVIMPFLVFGIVGFLLHEKYLHISPCLLAGGAILVTLSIPLFLFIMVNTGIIAEIITPFFSVPKMYSFRGNEIGFSYLNANFVHFLHIFSAQDNGRQNEVISEFGLYYHFSNLFILLGIGESFAYLRRANRNNIEYQGHCIMIIWLACSVLLGLLVDVNFVRINVIHYVLLFYCSYAIYKLFVYFGDGPLYAIAIAYGISTMLFLSTYVGSYTKDVTAGLWGNGAKEALDYANEMFPQKRLHVFDLTPSQVFYYEKIPTDIVAEQVAAQKSLGEFYAYHIFSNYIIEGITDDEPVYQIEDVYLYSKDNIEVNEKCRDMGLLTIEFEMMRVSFAGQGAE